MHWGCKHSAIARELHPDHWMLNQFLVCGLVACQRNPAKVRLGEAIIREERILLVLFWSWPAILLGIYKLLIPLSSWVESSPVTSGMVALVLFPHECYPGAGLLWTAVESPMTLSWALTEKTNWFRGTFTLHFKLNFYFWKCFVKSSEGWLEQSIRWSLAPVHGDSFFSYHHWLIYILIMFELDANFLFGRQMEKS